MTVEPAAAAAEPQNFKMRIVPKLYLGTMNFGWSQASSKVDQNVAINMIERFLHHTNVLCPQPICFIDTACIYAGGKTEKILGVALQSLVHHPYYHTISVGTKAHPSQPDGLSYVGIRNQLAASREALDYVTNVDEYYLHQPDTDQDLLSSLETVHQLKMEGLITSVGMSNYHYAEMRRAFDLCEQHNLTKPSVYQGLYNPLNRMVEKDLLPLLRENGCSFVAYNPLAAGLLTGKHRRDGEVIKGRFKNNENYLPRFYTDENFDAIDGIAAACTEANISMVDATFMWLLRHSALTGSDGVLIGASSMSQLEQNLDACAKAAVAECQGLPESVLQAMNSAWDDNISQKNPFPYWRSYSSDMPNRQSLDQGASYSAVKK
jgi:aflatoxin B1 aldehyde reductase